MKQKCVHVPLIVNAVNIHLFFDIVTELIEIQINITVACTLSITEPLL